MSDTNLMMAYGNISDEQMERELQHEDTMIKRGVDRFYKNIEKERERGAASNSPGGRALISGMTMRVADEILDEIARLESGRVKRKPPELKSLRLLPAKDTAVLAVKGALDACATSNGRVGLHKLAHMIGNAIAAEWRVRELKTSNAALYMGVVRAVAKRSSSQKQLMLELTRASGEREGISDPLTTTEKIRVGTFLCEILSRLGFFTRHTTKKAVRTYTEYELSNEVFTIISDTNDLVSEMRPYLLPTVIPPQPWMDTKHGGYWAGFRGAKMISRRTVGKDWNDHISDLEAPQVFTPVNYLQAVPFAVNPKVLEVVKAMRKGNIIRAGLPPAELEPFPAKPHDIDTNEEARREYAIAKRSVHTRNAQIKGKILAVEKTVMVAEEMKDEETIYFPKFVDFRGRVYDMPSFLHPQGDDLSKGLLQFANGKPLTEDGKQWLAIHTANCFGRDKDPIEDRIAWVNENMERLVNTGRDPMGGDRAFWMDADEPFQFLAACMEWAGYAEHGDEYLSHLPVAMDGSCNGLQHFSAMLRDPIGGKATNLTVEDRPQDIYTEVLNAVIKVLQDEVAKGEPLARHWLPLMKRKVVKRPVMTLPYGANRVTFCDQIKSDTLAPLEASGESPFDDANAAARYLAEILWTSVGSVVVAAQSAMGWLQEVAGIAVDHGETIRWTTPVGFPVMQEYRSVKTQRVAILCMGQKVFIQTAKDMDKQDGKLRKKKMKNAVAPNFVHSLDAAHMLMTVEAFRKATDNTGHLCMVHDSYACHASDAPVLAVTLRETFVSMYEDQDVLQDFADEVKAILPDDVELPEIPAKGSLDLSKLLDSLYFFA